MKLKQCIATLIFLLVTTSALAANTFTVKKIDIQGLSRIHQSTAMAYLPIHVGQTFTDKKGIAIIDALYKTDFFDNVSLSRHGNTLTIQAHERATVGVIRFKGNKAISQKQLKAALKKIGFKEGDFYNPAKLYMIREGLVQQYHLLGYNNVSINVHLNKQPHNRVAVLINVKEGEIAKVKELSFIGNHAFSDNTLRKKLPMTPTGLFSFFTHNDRYSQSKLNDDIAALQNYYLNNGYLKFTVVNKQVHITPENKVHIVITVNEGAQYKINRYKISHCPKNDYKAINKLITLKSGQTFSRQAVIKINKDIANYFADHGHADPTITTTPSLNEGKHTVTLTWKITQGRRVYVRYIHLKGNTRTDDKVLRSELRQLEGSTYSRTKINESKRRLANLPYLRNIEVTTKPVPNKPNQVDLTYHVKEVAAGRASVNGGYSDTDGFLYGASISEPDFLGTGKYVSLAFQHSEYETNYSFTWTNPYYTTTGISRSFSLYYQQQTPDKVNISSYTMDALGGTLTYGIPISDYDSLNAGIGFDDMRFSTDSSTPKSITDFLDHMGTKQFDEIKLLGGWSHSNLDRIIFPTDGLNQNLSFTLGMPATSKSLGYYKTSYNVDWYYPLIRRDYILHLHSNLGYGDGYGKAYKLPFFANYYGGGIDSLPGYEANTLGPKDNNGDGLGGNVMAIGGVDFIFPNHLSDRVRTALTVNAGNIYQKEFDLGALRYSTGLKVSWFTPIGPVLEFSFAKPLHDKPGDETQFFQFSLGASL